MGRSRPDETIKMYISCGYSWALQKREKFLEKWRHVICRNGIQIRTNRLFGLWMSMGPMGWSFGPCPWSLFRSKCFESDRSPSRVQMAGFANKKIRLWAEEWPFLVIERVIHGTTSWASMGSVWCPNLPKKCPAPRLSTAPANQCNLKQQADRGTKWLRRGAGHQKSSTTEAHGTPWWSRICRQTQRVFWRMA